MKACTVLPSTPARITASTAAFSVIECHGVPSASGGCTWLWYRQAASFTPSPKGQHLLALHWLLQLSAQGLWKTQHSVNPFRPFTVQIDDPAFLCVFSHPALCSLLFRSSPEAALGFCSLQQVTHS